MAMSLKDFLAEHPVDRERIDAHKARMLAEVREYRLRELREHAGLTQAQSDTDLMSADEDRAAEQETARQTRTVVNRYLVANLLRDGLLMANPIAGVALDQLTGTRATGERARGGKALSRAEYDAVLDYLLAIDPIEVDKPIRGRWTLADRIAKRRNVVDLALLQAASGLRPAEANQITWDHTTVDAATGRMSLDVTPRIAKGGHPRVALVLDSRVAARMLERRARASTSSECVIGSPSDAGTVWEARNRNKATAALYVELATQLGIPALETERSHIWRTTLHALYDGLAPTAVLNSQFGHSETTHQRHYTDASDLAALAAVAR